jgi:ABC-type uncharacterized transport system auxiliary subunit
MKRNHLSLLIKAQIVCVCAVMFAGCLPGSKPPQSISQYTIEYPPPVARNGAPFNATIRIDRFFVAQAFNSTAMVYRPMTYKFAVYNSNRWRVNPGDMVTDYLLRDVRASNIFRGVFSYRELEATRFVLEGGVEEFLEVDDADTAKAALVLSTALIDTRESELTKRLIYQRTYRTQESLKDQTPESLARAMSKAAERLSGQIVSEIIESVQRLHKE